MCSWETPVTRRCHICKFTRPKLPTVPSSGRLVCILANNFCPRAQGAAQAIEDGAVLGHLFEKVSHASQLPDILTIYEALRKPRTSRVVRDSTRGRRILHLPDGPAQEERDRQLQEERPFEGFAHAWADPAMQEFLYGYDARKEVNRAWDVYLSGQFPLTTNAWKL